MVTNRFGFFVLWPRYTGRMWIKPVVIILLIALFVSLFSGLFFFVKDQGTTRRTFYSLGIRLCIAVLLFSVTAYGLYTGELGHRVPWDPALRDTQGQVIKQPAEESSSQPKVGELPKGAKRQAVPREQGSD